MASDRPPNEPLWGGPDDEHSAGRGGDAGPSHRGKDERGRQSASIAPEGGHPRRRHLLQTLSAAGIGGLAGCSTVESILGLDDQPTGYGFGGTPTGDPGGGTPTRTRTDTPRLTDTETPSATRTGTPPPTSTSSPEEDYGEQGFGQYGYGGTR